MTRPVFEPHEIWVSEHYWPGVADEIVLALSQRLSTAPGWASSIVLPAQQTAFGLFLAPTSGAVRSALTRAGVPGGAIDRGWHLTRA